MLCLFVFFIQNEVVSFNDNFLQAFMHFCRTKYIGFLNNKLIAQQKSLLQGTSFEWLTMLKGSTKKMFQESSYTNSLSDLHEEEVVELKDLALVNFVVVFVAM